MKNDGSLMRKGLLVILLLASAFIALCITSQTLNTEDADDYNYKILVFEGGLLRYNEEGFRYRTLDDESVEIIHSRPSSMHKSKIINIPASVEYNGKTYKVTSIGEMAFMRLRTDNFGMPIYRASLLNSDDYISEIIIPQRHY